MSTLYRMLPTNLKIAVSAFLFIAYAFFWFFIGNTSSTYQGFSAKAEESKKRETLPKTFLPIPISSNLVGVEEIHKDSPYQGKHKIFVAYFHSGLLESSVKDYFDKHLKDEGWKNIKTERSSEGTFISLERGEVKGEIEIAHQSSGSDFTLTLIEEE